VLHNWEKIKRKEKEGKKEKNDAASATRQDSLLGDIPRAMPAMLEAGKLGSRAAKVGFDWPDTEGLFEKLREETAELRTEVQDNKRQSEAQIAASPIQEELGDLLFTTINLARHLKADPESALRAANGKFRRRFAAMEAAAGGADALAALSPEQLEELWSNAKKLEQSGASYS
jgi:XTP/dITP diphosphohydrolase/ATP diphosphatase